MNAERAEQPPAHQGLSYILAGSGTLAVEEEDCLSQIRAAITAADPGAVIADLRDLVAKRATDLHTSSTGTGPGKLWQEDAHVRLALLETVDATTSADVVVMYLPNGHVASTVAVQMYAARAAGKIILVVAADPSARGDWVIRAYSDRVFETVGELAAYLVEQKSGKDWEGLRRLWRPARHAV